MPRYLNNTQAAYSQQIANFRNANRCLLTAWEDCIEPSIGGVKGVFFTEFDLLQYAYLNSNGEVTGFENPLVVDWLFLPFDPNTVSFTTPLEKSPAGWRYVQTISATINPQDSLRRRVFTTMAYGKYGAIVIDVNDRYWLVGNQTPLKLVADEKTTGQNAGDKNGDTLTLTCTSTFAPRLLTQAAVDNLIIDGVDCSVILDGSTNLSQLPLSAIAGCPLTLIAPVHL